MAGRVSATPNWPIEIPSSVFTDSPQCINFVNSPSPIPLPPISVDNEGDELWLFMDSIKDLDGQLGIRHKTNIKDFFKRNLEALGSHTYNVDFSKRGHGVVLTRSSRLVASDVPEPDKEVIEGRDLVSEDPPFRGTITFSNSGDNPVEIIQPEVEVPISAASLKSQIRDEKKEKTIQEIEELADEIRAIPGFSEGQNYTYGQLQNLFPVFHTKSLSIEMKRAGLAEDGNMGLEKIAALIWSCNNPNVPTKVRKRMVKIILQNSASSKDKQD